MFSFQTMYSALNKILMFFHMSKWKWLRGKVKEKLLFFLPFPVIPFDLSSKSYFVHLISNFQYENLHRFLYPFSIAIYPVCWNLCSVALQNPTMSVHHCLCFFGGRIRHTLLSGGRWTGFGRGILSSKQIFIIWWHLITFQWVVCVKSCPH